MISREIEKYILSHIDEEDPLLVELNRETHLKSIQPRMISGHLQGLALTMFSKMIQPKNILEVGTFTGYSAICLARGLKENGKLYTIEIDDELEIISNKYFIKAGLKNQINQLFGDALKLIPTLDTTFDLVFLDGDKREYCKYYDLVFDKVVDGGYIIADNTLWSGKVIDSNSPDDEYTEGIIDFNHLVSEDKRVEKVIFPLRDGLTVIRKNK